MFDITALGELLIDFTPSGLNELGMQQFACNPGGAPANVLAMAARLECHTAFIGKVGQDNFGQFLRNVLIENSIDTTGLLMTPEVPTTLAFVHINEQGDRSFSFYRKPGADMMLTPYEVPKNVIDQSSIFHFGSVSMTDTPSREATLSAARYAKKHKKLISFDPNYRPPLWRDPARAKAKILEALPLADILKVSEEELVLLTGETNLARGAAWLAEQGPIAVLVSLGPQGAYYFTQNCSDTLPTYDVATIDTTGAGDAFLGAVLSHLCGKTVTEIGSMSRSEWYEIIDFANAAGSLTTTKKGAIPAMPILQEIERCRRSISLLQCSEGKNE